jgi:eukaryotic-like serine/threonine-protein kinase
MRLSPGDKLGPYEVTSLIGKGGMGEVYRGTDTRLNRPVAIKVSAREFNDRFEREARAISTLNHPNICTLHDVGPNYLVMEYIEGEMLSKLIEQGPLPLNKALAYAVQIVDALAAAHAKGVIHRDLKPGNIIITKNGAKVLDFGLAKIGVEKTSAESASNMETVTEPITRAGAVLGTLYYMAPEQVEGKETDERSDIFSFGAVFYEMITGQRPFGGDTQAAVLAALMKDQPPPMTQTVPGVPRQLERIVRKCLEKKPDDRWQSARDLKPMLEMIDLDAPQVGTGSGSIPVPVQSRTGKKWLWPGIAAVAVIGMAAVAAWAFWLKPAAPARATRFQVTLPENVNFSEYVSVSPDGHKLVFNATGDQSGLWIRDLDTLEWRRLAGTEGATSPFWSPDSRFLAFAVRNELKKIEVAGGPPQTLCTINGIVGLGAWSKDGVILFGTRAAGGGPLRRVSAAGGVPADVTVIDRSRGENSHSFPSFLPDGKHFLYSRGTGPASGAIYAGSLDAKPAEQPLEPVLQNGYAVPCVNGDVFFLRDGTLMVQPFDTAKLRLSGDPVPVAEHVAAAGSLGTFSVSPAGVLVYRSGEAGAAGVFQPTWFDRQGKATGPFAQPGPDSGLALSPDATRAAGRDAQNQAKGDIWVLDSVRGVRTRLTFRQSPGSDPVWSSDGTRIYFAAGSSLDTILEKTASGAGDEKELLKMPGEIKFPDSVSRDGRFLLYHTIGAPNTGNDLWVLPLEGERKPALLLGTAFNETYGSFSPDGRWIAYRSNESGRQEIYVRPFVASGSAGPSLGEGKWQVSKDGTAAVAPKWRNDGKELIFLGNSSVMAVDVNGSGPAFQMGAPQQLFTTPTITSWDVTGDGKRFLLGVTPGQGQQNSHTPITVVLNWQADIKRP